MNAVLTVMAKTTAVNVSGPGVVVVVVGVGGVRWWRFE